MKASQVKNTGYNEPFIAQRADPFIGKASDGTYYFTASVPEYDRLVLRHAKTIAQLKDAKEVEFSYEMYVDGELRDSGEDEQLTVIKLDGKWYLNPGDM